MSEDQGRDTASEYHQITLRSEDIRYGESVTGRRLKVVRR